MSRIAPVVVASAAAASLLTACSSSGTGGNHTRVAAPPATSVATSAAAPPAGSSAPPGSAAAAGSSAPPAASGIGGAWHGSYRGAYQGTFELTWRQSGSKLSGSIHISAPDTTLHIDGTLRGQTITFGTVGSLAITYSGSVSGTTMSGQYQVDGGGSSSGGPWQAAKA